MKNSLILLRVHCGCHFRVALKTNEKQFNFTKNALWLSFQGWMNELSVYDPDDYHISATRSVFVQLEGTNLRLQTPKHNVPKRAMWNEPPLHASTFIHQRFFDLQGSRIYLLPQGLVRKRIWSKKYPICVGLVKSGTKTERKFVHQGSLDSIKLSETKKDDIKDRERRPPVAQASLDLDSSQSNVSAVDMGYEMINTASTENLLYLFARTSREKEEWFRRLIAASKGAPLPSQMVELLTKLPAADPSSSRPSSVSSEKDLPTSSCDVSTTSASSPAKPSIPHSATDSNLPSLSANSSANASSNASSNAAANGTAELSSEELQLQYLRYMAKLMPTDSLDRFFASASLTRKVRTFFSQTNLISLLKEKFCILIYTRICLTRLR